MGLVEYGFKCINKKCKQKDFTDMLERDGDHTASCPLCGAPAQRVYSLAGFSMGFQSGFDYGLGQHVETESERDNICAREGIRRIKC